MSFVSYVCMPAFPLGRATGAGYRGLRSGRLSLVDSIWAALVRVVSVTGLFGLGRSCLETFRSGYEILQKFICSIFNANVL